MQSLYLEDQARQAWDEYLSRDSASDWAEDARRHLAALQRSATVRNDLARNNSPPAVSDTTVEAALDWILRQGLPDWAGAILAGDHASATRHHSSLRDYAQQIASTSGDPFAVSLTTLPAPDDAAATPSATAIRDFTRALALIDDDNLPEAEKPLLAVCPRLREPQAWLCDLELATLDVLRRNDAAARERSARAAGAGIASGSSYLKARAARLDAYRALFSGDYAAALREYRRAYDLAGSGKYRVQAGVMAAQLASVYDVVGPAARCVALADRRARGDHLARRQGRPVPHLPGFRRRPVEGRKSRGRSSLSRADRRWRGAFTPPACAAAHEPGARGPRQRRHRGRNREPRRGVPAHRGLALIFAPRA